MKIGENERNEAYEALMHQYLQEQLAKNVYEKKKMLDKEFLQYDKKIFENKRIVEHIIKDKNMLQYQKEIQLIMKEQILEFGMEMYRQGMRDMLRILK